MQSCIFYKREAQCEAKNRSTFFLFYLRETSCKSTRAVVEYPKIIDTKGDPTVKLSANTLKKLVRGACHFTVNRGYLASYHFSPAQWDYLSTTHDPYWLVRARVSAGVRIEMISDATEISFEYRVTEYSSPDNTVDVYCDGVAVAVYHLEGNGRGKVIFSLPEGEKEINVYLPSDCHFEIKNFTVNGRYKSARQKRAKVLLIGDSISQGYGAFMSGATYVNALQRMTRFEILNQGIGGFRYDPGILTPVDGFDPDKIIVALGTNYYDVPEYDYEGDVIRFYERLHEVYGDRPVLSITPLWRCDDWFNAERHAECIAIVKRECAKYPNVTVMDGYAAVPHIEESFCDKLHPNAYGSLLYAQSIARVIKEIKF